MSVIVTGASGHLGRLVAEDLLERAPHSDLVLVTRHPEALRDLANRGATVRYGDFDEPDSLSTAFAGGERMLLISTLAVGRRSAQHRAAIEAASAAGIRHVVYTSFPNPGPDHPVGPVATEHGDTEKILRESGLDWTVLRNATYAELQVIPGALAVAGGKLYTNAGDGLLVPVSRHDCAAAAASVLTTDGHEGLIHDITGEEALSQTQLADLLSEVSGRQVKLIPVGDRVLGWGLTRSGAPKPVARAIVAFGRAIREGYYDVVDPAVSRLTGRAPRTLRDVLIANRGELLAAV
ncbi:MAG: family NAD(P)-dependent oxidoreductase [Solirubrobacterales bacterium]|nr:family NAD(P)-dependent oxidoreductase [Solirubrobacterales bacterium]